MSVDLLEQTLVDLAANLMTTLVAKNHDYAAGLAGLDEFANFRLAEQFLGIPVDRAIMVRFLDKVARISSLLKNDPMVVAESIDDSILDAVGYLVILQAFLIKQRSSNG